MSKVKRPAKDTDFLALSMRVHAMEGRLLTRERMERMIEARDLSDAAKILTECGYGELREVTPDKLEAVLSQAQAAVFEDLGKSMDDPAMLDVFRCKYDYHNAKVLLKGEALDQDQGRLLSEGGRWESAKLAEDIKGGLEGYPETFRAGVAHAREMLANSGDPQLADFILDKAYFAELGELADAARSDFLRGYAKLAIDAANLRSAVRASRLGKGAQFLSQVLVEGGSVPLDRLETCRGADLGSLYRGGSLAEAAALGATLSAPGTGALTEFERLCDNAVMDYLAQGRMVPFGEQPIIGYVYAREAELTAIRIIMTGRMAGLDGETIRQRLRRAYA